MTTTLAKSQAGLPEASEWQTMVQMAEVFVKSGLLPEAIKTPAAALTIMQKGRELGIPPMYAFQTISIIKGKPTCQAELMLALVYRDHGDNAMQFVETTDKQARLAYRRRGWDRAREFTFTISDAERAGLMGSDTWRKYTPALLRARCISAVARMAFADSIGGMYTPEELGATVVVSDDGEVEVVDELRPAPESAVSADLPGVIRELEHFCLQATTPQMLEAARDYLRPHYDQMNAEQKEMCRAIVEAAKARLGQPARA